MSNVTKKTFIYILCGWIAFSSAFLSYQKSYSYAMEWAGVTIALDTALKALLGTIGITAGVGMASEVDWGAVRNDCMAFQQNQGNTSVEVGEWWSDIISGSLDTASDCWDSFKQWATSLTASSGASSGVDFSTLANYYKNTFNLRNFSVPNLDAVVYCSVLFTVSSNTSFTSDNYGFCFFLNDTSYTLNNGILSFGENSVRRVVVSSYGSITADSYVNSDAWYSNQFPVLRVFGADIVDVGAFDILDITPALENTSSGLFQSIDNSVINNLDIINQGDTVIEGDTIINLPWERVGDTASEVEEVIQGLIDRVNDGTLSLDNYTENIQNITNTYVYETTNNHIFPDPDNTDETIDDKINENKSNEGFTLFGLERFFPFCIPWDIYAFLGLLEADPQAPQINIPFPDPVTKEVDVYVLDLSPLEPVAVVLRYGFDLLFIIGLALATRRLIGAGGD